MERGRGAAGARGRAREARSCSPSASGSRRRRRRSGSGSRLVQLLVDPAGHRRGERGRCPGARRPRPRPRAGRPARRTRTSPRPSRSRSCPATITSGSKAFDALPSFTAPRKPVGEPAEHRLRRQPPALAGHEARRGPLTWGWKTIAAVDHRRHAARASCTADVAIARGVAREMADPRRRTPRPGCAPLLSPAQVDARSGCRGRAATRTAARARSRAARRPPRSRGCRTGRGRGAGRWGRGPATSSSRRCSCGWSPA